MEQELSKLHTQFDEIIEDLKKSFEYQNYLKAKKILCDCKQATETLNEIKKLQQARMSCKQNNQKQLVNELTQQIENLHHQYDRIFEVAQFNLAYEIFYKKVEKIKFEIEKQLN